MPKRTKEKPTPFMTFDTLGEETADKLDHLSGLLNALECAAVGGDLERMPPGEVGKALRLATSLTEEVKKLLEQLREHCNPFVGGMTNAQLKSAMHDAKRALREKLT